MVFYIGINLSVKPAKRITNVYNITRLPRPVEQRDLRASIILCPLAKENGGNDIRGNHYNNLTYELYRNGRFQIVPHKKEVIDRLGDELKLISEGWINATRAAKIGQRLNADYTVASLIRPTRNDIEIFGRLIDTVSGEVLAQCDAYELAEEAENFRNVYDRFAHKLLQNFPIIERKVDRTNVPKKGLIRSLFSAAKFNRVIIDLGINANIKPGMKFLAFHPGEPLRDSETGDIIVEGKVIIDGKLRAQTVKRGFSHLDPYDGDNIKNANYVVSQ